MRQFLVKSLAAIFTACCPLTAFADGAPVSNYYIENLTNAVADFRHSFHRRSAPVYDFDDPIRYTNSASENTPSFCAALAWCSGVGMRYGNLTYVQKLSLHRMLAAALSAGGYQTVTAIMNRQRVIGELEDHADGKFVEDMADSCPEANAENIFEFSASGRFDFCNQSGMMPEYAAIGGGKPDNDETAVGFLSGYYVQWEWNPPPELDHRITQFKDYNIALFGDIQGDAFAIRFEGHHVSLNLTYLNGPGGWRVYQSPIFFGSFPIEAPPSPLEDWAYQALWVEGQSLLASPGRAARRFVNLITTKKLAAGKVGSSSFPQAPPLINDVSPPWLLNSLQTSAPDNVPDADHAVLHASELKGNEDARNALQNIFGRFFEAMESNVGDHYRAKLGNYLDGDDTQLIVTWAGDSDEDALSNIFLRVAVGDLLVELVVDNQWSTQNQDAPTPNHTHMMFRDLSFAWDGTADLMLRPHKH